MTATNKKRVLVCEFHQETDTFNPFPMALEHFAALRYAEGQEAYDRRSFGYTVFSEYYDINYKNNLFTPYTLQLSTATEKETEASTEK